MRSFLIGFIGVGLLMSFQLNESHAQGVRQKARKAAPVFRPIEPGPGFDDTPIESFDVTKGSRQSSPTNPRSQVPVDLEPLESFDPRSRPLGTSAPVQEVQEVVDPTQYFEDLPGLTVSGVPRVIRSAHETEVFFNNLNQSYFIQQDNFHNRKFYAVESAMKSGSSITFRADPVTRRILFVDGIDHASSKPKPQKMPASVDSGSSSGGPSGKQ